MAKRSTVKHVKNNTSKSSGSKSNNYFIAIAAILGIFIIVYLALSSSTSVSSSSSPDTVNSVAASDGSSANVGQASLIAGTVRVCKFVAAPTTIYDSQSLSVMLEKGASTYYQGSTITVDDVTNNGCIISVGKSQDFLASGQLQKLGNVYITVTEILQQ